MNKLYKAAMDEVQELEADNFAMAESNQRMMDDIITYQESMRRNRLRAMRLKLAMVFMGKK